MVLKIAVVGAAVVMMMMMMMMAASMAKIIQTDCLIHNDAASAR